MNRFVQIFFLSIFLVIVFSINPNRGIADSEVVVPSSLKRINVSDKLEWSSDKKTALKLVTHDCKRSFDILWPWAKAGNQEARYILVGWLQWGDIYLPTGRDYATRTRDMLILSMHSAGYVEKQGDRDPRNIIYSIENVQSADKEFMNCVITNPTQRCSELAVKNQTIPSFEIYANQLDALLRDGKEVTCADSHESEDISIYGSSKERKK